jgi:hypothetical protein
MCKSTETQIKEGNMSIALLNAKVKITGEKYGKKYIGKIGVIENTSCGNTAYGVRIAECENPKSSVGLFWFAETEVEFIEREDEVMLSQNENFMVAGVKFLEGSNKDKEYFYALFDEYNVGDLVVVQTGHHGLALAEISSLGWSDKDKVKCSREIVTRVDMKNFCERKEKRKALAQLKKDMDKKVKELQETAIYELLAQSDPVLASMLADYKKLTGGA